MHKKSLFSLGFLLSSLVMLSAIPIFNNNAAIAQGYNTNSYYSQYPTDDKKYECRTGPFEGFFVSSVEFCKHLKFDDNKRDTKIGPQGPPGPAGSPGPSGATGATGPEGPPGITQLNTTQIYVKENNVTITKDIRVSNHTGTVFLRILCNPGDIAIDGQFIVPVDKIPVTLFSFTPGGLVPSRISEFNINSVFQAGVSADLSAYEIGVYGSVGSVVSGHAICLDNSP